MHFLFRLRFCRHSSAGESLSFLSSPEQQNKNRSPLSPWLTGLMNLCLNGGKQSTHGHCHWWPPSVYTCTGSSGAPLLVNSWGAVWLQTWRCYKHPAEFMWHLESATSVTNRNTPICSMLNSPIILNTFSKGTSNKTYPIFCCNLDYRDWN